MFRSEETIIRVSPHAWTDTEGWQRYHSNRFTDKNSNYIAFEAFVLLGCYAALSGSWLPMFRVSPSVPSSAVTDYKSMLLNNPEQQRHSWHRGGSL